MSMHERVELNIFLKEQPYSEQIKVGLLCRANSPCIVPW